MSQCKYRALVVDDEAYIRQLTMRALSRNGFQCELAADGAEALEMIESGSYDVVITDLRMPRQHGHALAVDLLARDNPPAVVVLTGLAEPRLAKDLLSRGVADVLFKPIDYDFLAAKLEVIAKQRAEKAKGSGDADSPPRPQDRPEAARDRGEGDNESALSSAEFEGKLEGLSKILPLSQAAFDVFSMARSSDFEVQQVAAAIARDASLSADVLRLANSSLHNPSTEAIIDLEQAVIRIGRKRVGDLALATGALASLTVNVVPWMNTNLAWRRSIAAGVAADALLACVDDAQLEGGVFLSAIMHPLGRISLGMLFPQQYQQMIRACEEHRQALLEQERLLFPLTHAEVMARLLERWNIPPAVYEPLPYVTHRYLLLARLAEPLRTKAELVNLAILIGRIAVGGWEPWDRVEVPPPSVLKRWRPESLAELVEDAKSNSEQIISFQVYGSSHAKSESDSADHKTPSHQLAYCNLSPDPFDFLAEIISSMGIELRTCPPDALDCEENVLVNCIWAAPAGLASCVGRDHRHGARLIVAQDYHAESYARFGHVLSMPASYAALRRACVDVAREADTQTTSRHSVV